MLVVFFVRSKRIKILVEGVIGVLLVDRNKLYGDEVLSTL